LRVVSKIGVQPTEMFSVSGNICTRLQEKILSKIPDDASKTMGLQKILNLGKGPPYELCLNIDVSDGLANGTPCIIKMFDYRVENSNRCSIIWVEFEDVKTGMHWRKKYCNLYRRNISVGWTPILETIIYLHVNDSSLALQLLTH
jgi:hypothetical protein